MATAALPKPKSERGSAHKIEIFTTDISAGVSGFLAILFIRTPSKMAVCGCMCFYLAKIAHLPFFYYYNYFLSGAAHRL